MNRGPLLLCLAFLLAVAGGSEAGEDDPVVVLAKSKEAAGGAQWDAVHAIHSRVRVRTSGLEGVTEIWDDVQTGRHVDTYELGPISGAEGWDGQSGWTKDSSGQTRRKEGGDEKEGAANEAYRRALAYWYPDRWPATIEGAGDRAEDGRRFRVVRITPRGGRPFDLWMEEKTGLIERIVEKAAIETRTTFLADYRVIEGKKVAFAVRSTNGETKYDQNMTVESAEFNAPIDDAKLAMPAPPPPDFAFAAGRTATTVPFELVNNHIFTDVKLNGKGPFRFLCDTGGVNLITPTLAAQLGIKPEGAVQGRGAGEGSEDVGFAKIEDLTVGDVTIQRQIFAVFPLEPFADVEGVPMLGLIGYEVFKRFVVRIDYERGLLTLALPSAFEYDGKGTSVPFEFDENTPQVEGSIDGIPGKFDIDTGSRASLTLFGPFVERNDLKTKLSPRPESVTGWGAGGPVRGMMCRAKELRLGDVAVSSPVLDLSLQQKGAFTNSYVAGNVGAGVLKRFNITFDYGGKRILFEPNANFGKPDVYNRSGMWVNRKGEALEVVDVTHGGPSEEAGLKAGDRIVAVDGKAVLYGSLVELQNRFRTNAPGTKIRLTVESAGVKREVDLVLRDLV